MNKDWQMCQVIGTLYLVYFTKVWTVLLLQHDVAVCTELLYKFLSNVIFCNVVSARIILCKTLKKKCTAFPYWLINLGFLFFFCLLAWVWLLIFGRLSSVLIGCISVSVVAFWWLYFVSRFLFTLADVNTREALENSKVYKLEFPTLSRMFAFKLCKHSRYFPSTFIR